MRALPARVEVYLKSIGENPSEFKYLGLANAGAKFSEKCENLISIPVDPLKPHHPLTYQICLDTKEVREVDSTD